MNFSFDELYFNFESQLELSSRYRVKNRALSRSLHGPNLNR